MSLKSSLGSGASISLELCVDKGESLEFVLVQVLNHFLIGRGQHWWVACEKAVKVLGVPSTLLKGWGGGEGRGGGAQEWMGKEGWEGRSGARGRAKRRAVAG